MIGRQFDLYKTRRYFFILAQLGLDDGGMKRPPTMTSHNLGDAAIGFGWSQMIKQAVQDGIFWTSKKRRDLAFAPSHPDKVLDNALQHDERITDNRFCH